MLCNVELRRYKMERVEWNFDSGNLVGTTPFKFRQTRLKSTIFGNGETGLTLFVRELGTQNRYWVTNSRNVVEIRLYPDLSNVMMLSVTAHLSAAQSSMAKMMRKMTLSSW